MRDVQLRTELDCRYSRIGRELHCWYTRRERLAKRVRQAFEYKLIHPLEVFVVHRGQSVFPQYPRGVERTLRIRRLSLLPASAQEPAFPSEIDYLLPVARAHTHGHVVTRGVSEQGGVPSLFAPREMERWDRERWRAV